MANGPIAEASVKVVADTAGFGRQLVSRVGAEVGRASGGLVGIGRKIGSEMYRGLDEFGGKVNNLLGGTLIATAGAAATGIGAVFSKGFGRLRAIDDAEAKLRGLGHTAEGVERIMDNAFQAVLGTAFHMGEAATSAAVFVAAGIEPGEELTRTLSLLADTAAIAGTDLSEMGMVFDTIAASGKFTGRELNQLSQRGIPVLQWLQEEYKITAEEAEAMVSSGEVSFAEFQDLVEKNIGGAAKEMGSSFRGALANMGAAAGRLGEVLLGPLFEASKGWFGSMTRWLDDLKDRVKPFAEEFGPRLVSWIENAGPRALAWIQDMIDRLQPLLEVGQEVIDWMRENEEMLDRIVDALIPAVGAVIGLASAVNLASRFFGLLVAATPVGLLIAIAGALFYAYQNSEEFRDAVDELVDDMRKAWPEIRRIIQSVADWFVNTAVPFIRDALGVIRDGAFALVDWFKQNWPTIRATAEAVFVWLRDVGWPILQQVFEYILDQAEALINWWKETWPDIQYTIEGIVEAIQVLWEAFGEELVNEIRSTWEFVKSIIDAALQVIMGIINVITGLITADWERVWNGIKMIFGGAIEAIVATAERFLNALYDFISTILSAISLIFQNTWDGIRSLTETIWNGIRDAVAGVVDAIWEKISLIWQVIQITTSVVWNTIKEAILTPIRAVRDLIGGIVQAIINKIGLPFIGLIDVMGRVWERIKEAILRPLRELRDAVGNIVGEILNKLNPLKSLGSIYGSTIGRIPGLAAGGIVHGPRFAMIGEAGPEAVIPLTRPARARQVMDQAGLTGAGGGPLIGEVVLHIGDRSDALAVQQAAEQGILSALAQYTRARGRQVA